MFSGSPGCGGRSTILPEPSKTPRARMLLASSTRSPDTPVTSRNPVKLSRPDVSADAVDVGPTAARPTTASRTAKAEEGVVSRLPPWVGAGGGTSSRSGRDYPGNGGDHGPEHRARRHGR